MSNRARKEGSPTASGTVTRLNSNKGFRFRQPKTMAVPGVWVHSSAIAGQVHPSLEDNQEFESETTPGLPEAPKPAMFVPPPSPETAPPT